MLLAVSGKKAVFFSSFLLIDIIWVCSVRREVFQAGPDCAGMDAGSGFLASFFCVKIRVMRTGAGNGGI